MGAALGHVALRFAPIAGHNTGQALTAQFYKTDVLWITDQSTDKQRRNAHYNHKERGQKKQKKKIKWKKPQPTLLY